MEFRRVRFLNKFWQIRLNSGAVKSSVLRRNLSQQKRWREPWSISASLPPTLSFLVEAGVIITIPSNNANARSSGTSPSRFVGAFVASPRNPSLRLVMTLRRRRRFDQPVDCGRIGVPRGECVIHWNSGVDTGFEKENSLWRTESLSVPYSRELRISFNSARMPS
jgi:hypothetical protein